MKFLASVSIGLLTTSFLYAQTTMCFKQNHKSITNIETVSLDGGTCSSSKSVKDMKNDGWKIDDIKIEDAQDGKNYIYIFKKDNKLTIDEEKIERKILERLKENNKQKTKSKKIKIKERMSKNGKEIYINRCQNCHGINAEKTPFNTSRSLIKLSYPDMKLAIRDYTLDEYDRGKAHIMKPYANYLTTKRLKDVYSYIQTLKDNNKTGDNK